MDIMKYYEKLETFYAFKIGKAALVDIVRLMYAKDSDKLQALYECKCCCDEHTFDCCKARWWGGCRSGIVYNPERAIRTMRTIESNQKESA